MNDEGDRILRARLELGRLHHVTVHRRAFGAGEGELFGLAEFELRQRSFVHARQSAKVATLDGQRLQLGGRLQ